MNLSDKLSPIYAAIDDLQFEKAIRLCGRKDIEKYDITKSLLAYSLYKSRKHAEALTVAKQVVARKPLDETILSTLALTLRGLNADEDLLSIYENAFELNQTNEYLGVDLFQCYAKLM